MDQSDGARKQRDLLRRVISRILAEKLLRKSCISVFVFLYLSSAELYVSQIYIQHNASFVLNKFVRTNHKDVFNISLFQFKYCSVLRETLKYYKNVGIPKEEATTIF